MNFRSLFAVMVIVTAAGCGQNSTPPASTATPAPAAAPAAQPKPGATLTLIEPAEGAMGGHIDTFRWSSVAGADGYVIKIVAVTGNRIIWESAPMAETETRLPTTVALEPEVHTWTVSARKGSEVLATAPPQKFTITP
ncbi:MAG: hypothetical protein ABI983_01440 [Acidobacteriota bacterium]